MGAKQVNLNNTANAYGQQSSVPSKLNQNVYIQKNCKSQHYSSYEEYARKLLTNEGISPITDAMVKQTAAKIKQMNGGVDIKQLDTIKCPVSNEYKARLENNTQNTKKQQNSIPQNLNENIYIQRNCKSQHYTSYEDYARKLLTNEGVSPITDAKVKQTAAKIKQMNGGVDIKQLDTIKCPVSNEYKAKLEQNAQRQQLRNRQQGNAIARDIYDAVDGLGTDTKKLDAAIQRMTKDNAAETVLNYRKHSGGDEGIFESIIDEVGLTKDYQKQKLVSVYANLQAKAKELGINISDLNKEFDKIMDSNSLLSNKEKLDSILETLATRVNSMAGGTTQTTTNQGHKPAALKMQAKTYNTICKNYNNAVKNYNNQLDWDGWCEDVANYSGHITDAFNGKKNYRSAVLADLKTNKANLEKLKDAQQNHPEQFAQVFKEIYGVDYNPDNIQKYEKIKAKWAKVDAAHSQVEHCKTHDMTMLMGSKEMNIPTGYTKQQALNNALQTLGAAINPQKPSVGVCEVQRALRDWVKKERPDLSLSDIPIEMQYAKIREFAQNFSKAAQANLKKELGNRSYESYMTEAKSAYKAAFGFNNDAAARVEDFCHSQKVGGQVVKTGAEMIAVLASGGTASAAVAGATNITINVTNDMTSTTRQKQLDRTKFLEYAAEGLRDAGIAYVGKEAASAIINKYGKDAFELVAKTEADAFTSGAVTEFTDKLGQKASTKAATKATKAGIKASNTMLRLGLNILKR